MRVDASFIGYKFYLLRTKQNYIGQFGSLQIYAGTVFFVTQAAHESYMINAKSDNQWSIYDTEEHTQGAAISGKVVFLNNRLEMTTTGTYTSLSEVLVSQEAYSSCVFYDPQSHKPWPTNLPYPVAATGSSPLDIRCISMTPNPH